MLVADRDRVLDLEAVGSADIAAGTPMATDCLFWIASESKPITASALMILVDAGRVSLDDPVGKFLPEFRKVWLAAERDDAHMLLKRPHRPITVRDLLTHTSGLPFSSALETPTLDGLPLRDAARSYALTPLNTEPGAKYQYSNAGINTVGRIIEIVAGESYEQFLRTRLFEPARDGRHHLPADRRAAKTPRPGRTSRPPPRTTSNRPQSASYATRSTTPRGSRCPPAGCSAPPPTWPGSAG